MFLFYRYFPILYLDNDNSDVGDASPTAAMTLDSSPSEGSIVDNFITGDAKPTDSAAFDDSSQNNEDTDANKGKCSSGLAYRSIGFEKSPRRALF